MTPLISLVCLVSLTAGCQKSAPAKGGALLSVEGALAEYRSATLGYLRFLEGRLEMKTKLRRKGIASDDEVDFYSFNAALERCILARVDGDSEATLKQYKAVIAVRQSQLERTRRLHERGGGMDAEMDLIQRQLQLGAPHSEKPRVRFEAESQPILARGQCECNRQDMEDWGRGMGSWSGREDKTHFPRSTRDAA